MSRNTEFVAFITDASIIFVKSRLNLTLKSFLKCLLSVLIKGTTIHLSSMCFETTRERHCISYRVLKLRGSYLPHMKGSLTERSSLCCSILSQSANTLTLANIDMQTPPFDEFLSCLLFQYQLSPSSLGICGC